jgi:hypothetical protein
MSDIGITICTVRTQASQKFGQLLVNSILFFRGKAMNRYKQDFPTTLALSSLLVATLTAFSAQAALSPGYAYDSSGKVEHNSLGKCIQTSLWSKDNATKECHPELFPEPVKVAEPPPPPPPPPARQTLALRVSRKSRNTANRCEQR